MPRHVPPRSEFAVWLRKQLQRNDMLQSELADRMGINRATVNHWAVGSRVPGNGYLIELADMFNRPMDELRQAMGRAAPGEYPADADTRGDMMRLAGSINWEPYRVAAFEGVANVWKEEDRARSRSDEPLGAAKSTE